jgi:hypothetical protein
VEDLDYHIPDIVVALRAQRDRGPARH